MKKILVFMGAAFTLAGFMQPATNIPQIPEAHAAEVASVKIAPEPSQAPVSPEPAEAVVDTAQQPEAVTEPTVQPQTYTAPVLSVSEAEAKAFIYQHESGNNPGAINASSGACGLGQALPCSKLPCTLDDYGCQDAWFTNYAMQRYGSWNAAYTFWQNNRWW